MRRVLSLLTLLTLICSSWANAAPPVPDSTLVKEQAAKIDRLQEQVQSLSTTVGRLRNEINQQNKKQESLENDVDNLGEQVGIVKNALKNTSDSLLDEIGNTKEFVEERGQKTDRRLSSRTWAAGIMGFLLLLLSVALYSLLRKRLVNTSSTIDAVKKAHESLQEQSIKLDQKLVSLFDSQLSVQPTTSEDHSLVLKIANELARMETNLSRMDTSVKGHKQLGAAVKRIKENLSANGYEFVDMLGKPYHEGMVVDADFVSNEDLDEGTQIISGVTKPQVNYNGKMIQSAKITVSQNI